MTSELHNLQVKKQLFEAKINSLNANKSATNENFTNSNDLLDQESNYSSNKYTKSSNDHTSLCNIDESNSINTNENNYNNDDNVSIDNDDHRIIGSPSTDSIKSYDSNPTGINNNENDYHSIPRVKLEHPTSLSTTTNNNKANLKTSYISNINQENYDYENSIIEEAEDTSIPIPSYTSTQNNIFPIIESSPMPTPISISSNNQDILNHNNRSFTDLNLTSNVLPNGYHPTPSTLSPTASMAMTPTYLGNSNGGTYFFRIFIGSSTTVVEKKTIPLRDLLFSKLKSRDLDVDKCIAYIKESK
jgi:hypothetical protein